MPHHNAQPPPHYSTQPSPHAPQGAAYHPPPQAGPSSHDYNRDPNDRIYLPNEPQVHALLAERLMAKKTKDFAKADAMRETLRMAGVEVMDREKLWRAIPPPQGAVGGPPQPIPQAPMAQSARPSANQQP